MDLRDCPLRLPEFAGNNDHYKLVPRYSSVLKRSEQDGIGLEDVDTLQLELEALLSATVVRKITLKDEVKVLNNLERYKGQSKSSKRGPMSPGKRSAKDSGSSSSRSSVKKFKSGGTSGATGSGTTSTSGGIKPLGGGGNEKGVIGIPKTKQNSESNGGGGGAAGGLAFDPLQNEQIRPLQETAKPNLPKNETPNRFWAFVEPYCAPISPDDIKLLDDLIRSHNDMSEYFRVPKLGQHYTIKWANEDLEYERSKSAAANDANSEDAKNGGGASSAAADMLKKGEGATEKTPYGELTQRLVAGLIEDNLMTSVEDSNLDVKKQEPQGESSSSAAAAAENSAKAQLIKSLNVTNAEALEARVKRELQDQGILDVNDDAGGADAGSGGHDEIYEELIRCQNELRAISAHNLNQLKRLTKAAREEMGRQELRAKLNAADQEVMEAYKKISSARSKKKPPTKKEREQAWKALKEREVILKQLESI